MTDSGRFFPMFLSRSLPYKPWQLALIGLFGLFAGGVVLVALVALILTPTLPSIDNLADSRLKVPLRVYTADNHLIAEFGEEKRIPVKIEEVPKPLIHAILAAEDHTFYQHHGVDFLGIVRAAWYNFRAKRSSQGASTITMQVARNFFLSPEKTYTRKLKEALLAFKIERELSKDEILELYINKIFLGHRAYGFAAAARIYYGKSLQELTLPEMSMLAGLPKAPSRDNPLSNPESAMERRNYVLRHMQNLGYIDETAFIQAYNSPLTASRHAFKYDVEAPYIAEMVRQYMLHAYDEKTYAGGFHVYTTILSKNQRAANQALRKGLLEYERRHGYRGPEGRITLNNELDKGRLDDVLKDYRVVGDLLPGVVLKLEDKTATVYSQDGYIVELGWPGLSWARAYVDENTLGPTPKEAADILKSGDIVYLEFLPNESPQEENGAGSWRLAPLPRVAGSLVSLRPDDGAVLALVGGFDFAQSNFNRVIQAERQPGSGLKPFIYTAALEKGFTAASTVSGAPIVIEDATLEDEWRPENYSKKFFGPTRLRKALSHSLNLVSVRLLRATGAGYTADYMERFGFDPEKLPRNLSLALGTASVTPLQMVSAFAVFANGGFRIQPYFITRVEDANHNILEQAKPYLVCRECEAQENPGSGANNKTASAAQSSLPHNPFQKISGETLDENTAARRAQRVLSPEINFIMTDILRDVIREGTGRRARELKREDLAGKTGTTNEYNDAWFSGFNADVVTTTWVGFDQPTTLGHGEAGSRAALPIWIDYTREVMDGVPEKPLPTPENIETRLINRETGKPTDENDPEAMEEYFIKSSEVSGEAVTDGQQPAGSVLEPIQDNVREKLF